MKIHIVFFGLLISSCVEMGVTNKRLAQKQNQSLSLCDNYTIQESGLLVASCTNLETKTKLENQKEMLLPDYLDFVVDEKFVLSSDMLFESAEYKECRTTVLEKLAND